MLNIKQAILIIGISCMPFTASAHECYQEFRNIGEKRMAENKVHTAKLMDILTTVQKKKNISFEAALDEYRKVLGNKEIREIDAEIRAIDIESEKLNTQVSEKAGESECKRRMALERKRSQLATRKFEAVERALAAN